MIDFRSKWFTLISIVFMGFFVYKNGYLAHKSNTAYQPTVEARVMEATGAKYKITLDPDKPAEQMSFVEKMLMKYAMHVKAGQDTMLGIKAGDQVRIRLQETLKGQDPGEDKEVTVIIGQTRLKPYIDDELLKMKVGETKEFEALDTEQEVKIKVKVLGKVDAKD